MRPRIGFRATRHVQLLRTAGYCELIIPKAVLSNVVPLLALGPSNITRLKALKKLAWIVNFCCSLSVTKKSFANDKSSFR